MNGFVPASFLSIGAFWVAYVFLPGILRRLCPRMMNFPIRVRWLVAERRRSADAIFYFVVLIAVVGLCARGLHSYESFSSWYEFRWNIDRVVLGLLRGGSLLRYLGDRYNPFVVMFVPLYAAWNDPRVILLLQSIGLGFAALPLYWSARREVGRALGFAVGLAYLVSPYLQNLDTGDIFELKFSIPLLALAGFFLLRHRYVPFLISLGVALAVKEDIALIAFACSLFILLVQHKRVLGFALAALSVVLVFGVTEFLYPYFHAGDPFYIWAERYGYLGNTLQQVALSILQYPAVVIEHIAVPSKIDYVLYLLGPLGILAIFGAEVTAIILPGLLFAMLSTWEQQTSAGQYYQAPLVPFIFFGAVAGMARIVNWRKLEPSRARLAGWFAVIAAAQLFLPATWTRVIDPASFSVSQHDAIGHQLIQQIPAGARVVAQLEFVVSTTGTRQYTVTHFSPDVDYRSADYIFGDSTRFWYDIFRPEWEHWRASGYFDTVVDQDGYFLLKHKPAPETARQRDNGWAMVGYTSVPNPFDHPLELHFENGMTLLNYFAVPSDKVKEGEKLRVITEWQARVDITAHSIVLARLQDAQGHVWARMDRPPVVPTINWKAGDIVRDEYDFDVPRIMPPGDYRLTIAVWDPQQVKSLQIRDADDQDRGIEANYGTISVEKDHSIFPASYLQIEAPLSIDLAKLRLLGTTTIPSSVASGDVIPIGLYWQARTPQPDIDYAVTMQLEDRNGQVIMEQRDAITGDYPTSRWHTGEIFLDWHDFNLPAGLIPETYVLYVGLQRQGEGTIVGRAKIGLFALH